MMLVPSTLPPAQCVRLVGQSDNRGVRDGEVDLALAVWVVKNGLEVRIHLYLLRDAAMNGIIAVDQDLECSVIREMKGDIGVRGGSANTLQDFSH